MALSWGAPALRSYATGCPIPFLNKGLHKLEQNLVQKNKEATQAVQADRQVFACTIDKGNIPLLTFMKKIFRNPHERGNQTQFVLKTFEYQ